ncbi:hypothetical protein DHW03_01050 [Pedobacter yonginense]|jgi:hypothetical protein|uniref:Uncharacterized protein n=1 Tax=Pedobacter yonginense TaxID=651869 RepID=A0A317EQR2_9SPHI|nr:hypothetical protein [Pedobacter yonginense]PWS28477.1 hypothetical protein DHW03_01050 [Pedobacter yonginense]
MENQKSIITKNRKVILIAIAVVIIISNTPPMQFFLLENYNYQNADGSFKYTEEPGQALDFKVGERRWERFKTENSSDPNQTLYRTFRIKPWQFWEWWQFIAHGKRFTLPYLSAPN